MRLTGLVLRLGRRGSFGVVGDSRLHRAAVGAARDNRHSSFGRDRGGGVVTDIVGSFVFAMEKKTGGNMKSLYALLAILVLLLLASLAQAQRQPLDAHLEVTQDGNGNWYYTIRNNDPNLHVTGLHLYDLNYDAVVAEPEGWKQPDPGKSNNTVFWFDYGSGVAPGTSSGEFVIRAAGSSKPGVIKFLITTISRSAPGTSAFGYTAGPTW
jgi:hypothetical protein